MKLFCLSACFFFFVLLFTACQSNTSEQIIYQAKHSDIPPIKNKKVYIFGIHPLHNPKRLFEVYQPMVDLINENLEDATLRLEASRNYASYDKKLFSGYFDLSLPNPYQTVVSIKKGYKVFGKMSDDQNFKGIILVRKDSHITKTTDLKGKVVSYPAPTALAATMMPQWYLHHNGIDVNKDIKNIYVGSQESSIMSVYLGESVAASTWPPPWNAFIKERPEIAKEVEIKWQTKSLINNGLVYKQTVPREVLQKIKKVIFSLHTHKRGQEILKKMELSKYEKANNETYDVVKVFLNGFEKEIRNLGIENE